MTVEANEQGRRTGRMSRHAAALVAWFVCSLSFALTTLSLLLLALNLGPPAFTSSTIGPKQLY